MKHAKYKQKKHEEKAACEAFETLMCSSVRQSTESDGVPEGLTIFAIVGFQKVSKGPAIYILEGLPVLLL